MTMSHALFLLMIQGFVGAFDTVFYHEYKSQLVTRILETKNELVIHALRDFLYAILFVTLPLIAWQGLWLLALIGILLLEIVLTLWDFVIEKQTRKSLGDVFAGERVTHALMGILYGALIVYLIPTLTLWWSQDTALIYAPVPIPFWQRVVLIAMGVGVFASGCRDLYAAFGLPGGTWPWRATNRAGGSL